MMKPAEKNTLLNEVLNILYNREENIINNRCVFCDKLVTVESFRDDVSLNEYTISGLCQDCQDKIFVDCE